MREMPVLETERLLIRPLVSTDTQAVHEVLRSIDWVDGAASAADQRAAVERYVAWSALNHRELARLNQPPYGDRAVVLRSSGAVIGVCGFVPYVDAFGVFPSFGGTQEGAARAEVGVMWAIGADHQRSGYATEVARRLIGYALDALRLIRLIATTEHHNRPSQSVMRNAGMRLETNPFDAPPWLQVLGIIGQERLAPTAGDLGRPDLDHIELRVADVRRSREFYLHVLGPLGYRLVRDFGDEAAGLGTADYAVLALVRCEQPSSRMHLAFRVWARSSVDSLYRAALAAGAADNGPPGLRAHYHSSYYAAFVHDPEGNNLEFVCHRDQASG